MIYVDTSAFLSIFNTKDLNHKSAAIEWEKLVYSKESLICTNYVLLETFSLLQNRSGMMAVSVFQEDIIPVIKIEWVTVEIHNIGIKSLITANRRELSLVDCISFEVMRNLAIKKVFTFDKHFKEQGFICLPL